MTIKSQGFKRVAWLYPCNRRVGYTLILSLVRQMRRLGILVDEYNTINDFNIYDPRIVIDKIYDMRDCYDAVFVLDLGYLNDERLDRSHYRGPIILVAGDNPQSYSAAKLSALKNLKRYIFQRPTNQGYFGEYYGHELTAYRYDGVLTSDLETMYRYQKMNVPASWFPYWADTVFHYPLLNSQRAVDLVTVMTPRTNRNKTMKLLEDSKDFIYSNGYGKSGIEVADHYRSGKIVFNKSNYGEITMRIPEAMACGAMMLTDQIKEKTGLYELFEPRKDLETYSTDEELFEKVLYYSKHESSRNKISNSGAAKVLKYHTQVCRVETMLNFSKSLKR